MGSRGLGDPTFSEKIEQSCPPVPKLPGPRFWPKSKISKMVRNGAPWLEMDPKPARTNPGAILGPVLGPNFWGRALVGPLGAQGPGPGRLLGAQKVNSKINNQTKQL